MSTVSVKMPLKDGLELIWVWIQRKTFYGL